MFETGLDPRHPGRRSLDISAPRSVRRATSMRAIRGRSASFRRRFVGVAAVSLLLLMALAPTAGAGLKQSLDQAKARLAELKRQIEAQQVVLDRLSAEAAAIAMQIDSRSRTKIGRAH